MVTQTWALTTWDNRTSATYVSVDSAIDGKYIDAYGRLSTEQYNRAAERPRRPYMVDEDNGVAYIVYDNSSAAVPVIKMVES